TFKLYLPSDGRAVTLPLRRASSAPDPLLITLRARGRHLDDVTISGDSWSRVPVQLLGANLRFELVEFAVEGGAGDRTPLVLVGKEEVHPRWLAAVWVAVTRGQSPFNGKTCQREGYGHPFKRRTLVCRYRRHCEQRRRHQQARHNARMCGSGPNELLVSVV